MQYTTIFPGCKNDSFLLNVFDYFHIFAQNIYCVSTLEPPPLAISWCISDIFTEWKIILILSSKRITWSVRNAKFESVSVLTDQICV